MPGSLKSTERKRHRQSRSYQKPESPKISALPFGKKSRPGGLRNKMNQRGNLQNDAAPSLNKLTIQALAEPVIGAPGWVWRVHGPHVEYWGYAQSRYDAPGILHWHIRKIILDWVESIRTGKLEQLGEVFVPLIVIAGGPPEGFTEYSWTPLGNEPIEKRSWE